MRTITFLARGALWLVPLIALGGALLVLISNKPGDAQGGGEVTISVKAPLSDSVKIPIAVIKGKECTITLPSNPTTGYQWKLGNKPNSKVVSDVVSEYNAPAEPIPGRGGTETWTFMAAGKGTTAIVLKYIRPWERTAKPARTQVFNVTVQ